MGFGIPYLAIVRARQVDGWSSILACCTGSGDEGGVTGSAETVNA